jgi:adenosylhomocysteinase
MKTLKAGGADVAVCASNPLSTRDDICASLVAHDEIPVFARYNESLETYYRHVDALLARKPQIAMDDGADIIARIHELRGEGEAVFGALEETTTGVLRVRAIARSGVLRFPVIAVNDTPTKRFFDNRYGTGQNTIDGILRATNILIAGKTVVVAGFGWVGRGIASRMRGSIVANCGRRFTTCLPKSTMKWRG